MPCFPGAAPAFRRNLTTAWFAGCSGKRGLVLSSRWALWVMRLTWVIFAAGAHVEFRRRLAGVARDCPDGGIRDAGPHRAGFNVVELVRIQQIRQISHQRLQALRQAIVEPVQMLNLTSRFVIPLPSPAG